MARLFSYLLVFILFSTTSASGEQAGAAIRFRITEFVVEGDNPLSGRATRALLAEFVGEHSGLDKLQAATERLEDALAKRGYTFHTVSLPPQSLQAGVVRLEITAPTLGHVDISGNRFFSDRNILTSLPELRPAIALIEDRATPALDSAIDEIDAGRTPALQSAIVRINTRRLSRALQVANMHPTKKTRLRFIPGDDPSQINANIVVEDQRPLQRFVWLNNTGSESTGETRLGFGLQHGNLFDRDHVATFTYTTSPDKADDVRQYGLQYQIPLYRIGGLINGFYAKSDVDTGRVADFFDVSGAGTVAGVRYTQLFAKRGRYGQRLAASITDKLFENDVDFEGMPLGTDVRSRPLALRYLGQWKTPRLNTGYYLDIATNLSGGSNNDDLSYTASRSGSDSDWSALRFGASATYLIKDWVLMGKLDGQHTAEPLIPGEQFGLGGVNSVRGFEEREISGDRGLQAKLEAWAPPFRKTNVRVIGFLDTGAVRLEDPLPGENSRENIASIGLGLRGSWGGRLSWKLDWGYATNGVSVNRVDGTQDGDSKLHFNLGYRF